MKIRNGHVTNSSSSSFILTISIGLKNDDIVMFSGTGGCGECGRTDYFDNDAVVKVSPKELAKSRTVDSMIKKLTDGVVDRDIWTEEEIKIFEKSNPTPDDGTGELHDAYDFIKEIKEKISKMSDIEYISISGNEYNYMNYLQDYTYYRDTKEYVGTVDGCEFEKDGDTGGSLEFDLSDCDIEYNGECYEE